MVQLYYAQGSSGKFSTNSLTGKRRVFKSKKVLAQSAHRGQWWGGMREKFTAVPVPAAKNRKLVKHYEQLGLI